MKWLSNIGKPDLHTGEHDKEWLRGKIIRRPKATKHYTADELEAMGLVGVYKVE